jgi:hypothetical protein
MRHVAENQQTPYRVLVTFGESVHCFLLQSGATFGDLADRMRSLECYDMPASINMRISRADGNRSDRRPLDVYGLHLV